MKNPFCDVLLEFGCLKQANNSLFTERI